MVGQNIGKYRVLDRIGRGGMGTVYRAIDETLHREVAIKVLNAELNDPEVAKRFKAEAITVARMSHPGIATIYELFMHEGQWLMVMEFVRGETLEHMVDRMGALSPQRSAELCMQALAALAHAHSMGVVHRDLKPANLMITETGAVKIMDFGIARVAGTEHLTNAGFMMGTPAYMAPEQVRGQEIDARADLYAMGVVFYRLTTGKLPFKGETPFAMAQSQVNDPPTPVTMLRSDLPPWVDVVVTRALQKTPEQRFQSAVEFHEAFARCLAGLPLSTMYGAASSAPTELLTTPSRPMPTGSIGPISPSPPLPSAYSGSIPTMATPSRMPSATGSAAASGAIPQAASASGALPVSAEGAGSVRTEISQPVAAGPKTAGPSTAVQPVKRNNAMLLGVAAVVILMVGALAMFLMRSRSAPEPEPLPPPPPPVSEAAPPPVAPPPPVTPDPNVTAGAGTPPTTPPATPPGATTPPGGTPPAGSATSPTATGRSTAPGTLPPGTTAPPTGRGTDPAAAGTTPGTGGRATTPPIGADAPLAAPIPDIKMMTVEDRRVSDQDVMVTFGGGEITVLPRKGGTALVSVPYKNILKATYIHSSNPRWDAALPGPEKFDASGLLNRARHWLVLQTKSSYTILRLDGDSWLKVQQAFDARTGLKIDRPEK